MIKNSNLKRQIINHIKKGINHINLNHSIEAYTKYKEIRRISKNIYNLSWYELGQLLRKTRKLVSNKWVGSKRWHYQCSFNVLLISKNIHIDNKTVSTTRIHYN